MHKRDGDRSLAHGRRHALDVAAAHVTNGEDAGAIRLEQIGRADELSRDRDVSMVNSGKQSF